jgi:hypothetical protein
MVMPVEVMPNEEVVQLVRRHPVHVLIRMTIPTVMLLISAYILFVMDPDIGIIGSMFEFVFASLGVLALLAMALFTYRYYYDVWIITSQRLIDSARDHPFHKKIKVTNLSKVQDVAVSKTGILATLLDFGDVRCRTASTDSNFVFLGIGEPTKIMETINRAISKNA